jgi:hypothetical protein
LVFLKKLNFLETGILYHICRQERSTMLRHKFTNRQKALLYRAKTKGVSNTTDDGSGYGNITYRLGEKKKKEFEEWINLTFFDLGLSHFPNTLYPDPPLPSFPEYPPSLRLLPDKMYLQKNISVYLNSTCDPPTSIPCSENPSLSVPFNIDLCTFIIFFFSADENCPSPFTLSDTISLIDSFENIPPFHIQAHVELLVRQGNLSLDSNGKISVIHDLISFPPPTPPYPSPPTPSSTSKTRKGSSLSLSAFRAKKIKIFVKLVISVLPF